MPQLMPFYWVNFIFMVFMLFFSLIIFYFMKNNLFLKNMFSKHITYIKFMW